jgi:hypothetical protein
MKWRNTRYGPAWVAVAVALFVWVLLPVAHASANDDTQGGEFYTGEVTGHGSQDVGGPTPPGGLQADPDTFQIDAQVGGSPGEIQSPLPAPGSSDGFFTLVRNWLMVVLSGGFLRHWLF